MLKCLFLFLDAATKRRIPRETQIANGQREAGVICPNRAFHLLSQVRPCRRAAFTVDLHFYQRWPFTPSAAPPPSRAVAEISGWAEAVDSELMRCLASTTRPRLPLLPSFKTRDVDLSLISFICSSFHWVTFSCPNGELSWLFFVYVIALFSCFTPTPESPGGECENRRRPSPSPL